MFLTAAVGRMSLRLFLARLGKNRVVSSGSSQSRCIIGRVWKRGGGCRGVFYFCTWSWDFLIEAQTEQEMQIILDGRMHSDVMVLQLELLVARTT